MSRGRTPARFLTAGAATFTGNVVDGPNDDGLDALGTQNLNCTGNVFRNIPGSALVDFTPSATKVDGGNVKD